MKLPPIFVEHLSDRIAWSLQKEGLIESEKVEEAAGALRAAILEDLQVEDRLNEEVREILRSKADEMTRLGVQYHDMFRMIKAELVRQRKLIL